MMYDLELKDARSLLDEGDKERGRMQLRMNLLEEQLEEAEERWVDG